MLMLAFSLGVYFTLAAVQGEYGVFKKAQIIAKVKELTAEKQKLEAELARVENLTWRLSDQYLDLDLLDEQARDILGYVRADEIVIR